MRTAPTPLAVQCMISFFFGTGRIFKSSDFSKSAQNPELTISGCSLYSGHYAMHLKRIGIPSLRVNTYEHTFLLVPVRTNEESSDIEIYVLDPTFGQLATGRKNNFFLGSMDEYRAALKQAFLNCDDPKYIHFYEGKRKSEDKVKGQVSDTHIVFANSKPVITSYYMKLWQELRLKGKDLTFDDASAEQFVDFMIGKKGKLSEMGNYGLNLNNPKLMSKLGELVDDGELATLKEKDAQRKDQLIKALAF